jgi:hypothetical protein
MRRFGERGSLTDGRSAGTPPQCGAPRPSTASPCAGSVLARKSEKRARLIVSLRRSLSGGEDDTATMFLRLRYRTLAGSTTGSRVYQHPRLKAGSGKDSTDRRIAPNTGTGQKGDRSDVVCLSVESKLRRSGGVVHLVVPPNASTISARHPKAALIKAVARA